MLTRSRPKHNLFSPANTVSGASKTTQMKSLILHLMDESPKGKLRYGTLKDVLRKPVFVSPRFPECTCALKKPCALCSRLTTLRSQVDASASNASPSGRLPSVPSGEMEELALLDISELSLSRGSEESSENEAAVAEVLQSLFQEADHDAKRAAKESVRQYRSALLQEQTDRFDKLSQGLLSRNAEVLTDFAERQYRLESELNSAERKGDACPTSPISALINEMEQHRLGRESDFRNRMKSVRSATMRAADIENGRAEISLALAKLQNCRSKCLQMTVPTTARLNETIRSVEEKVYQLSSLNVETLQFDQVAQTVAEANRAADECYSAIEECESAAKAASQPQLQPRSLPPTRVEPFGASHPPAPVAVPVADADRLAAAKEAKEFVENWRARLKPFMEDPNFKAQRQELQRAVFSLVNMLSSESELSSRIPVKLNMILDGHTVEVAGKNVSAKCHELGVDFVKLAICKKLIGQAEEEISSQPSVAGPLANAALPLIVTRPDMAKLLVSYFYITCPLLVPVVPIGVTSDTLDSTLEQLGYKKRQDGTYEGLERFLKRMSGIATLFGALAVAPLPSGQPRPITVGTIWSIISFLLKMPPFPDLTPTILYELLKSCSKQLFAAYGRQFDKMGRTLKQVFLPKLDAESGSVSTLKHFLNTEVAAICNWPLGQNT